MEGVNFEKFVRMQEDITHIKEDVGELKTTLKDFIEHSEKQFAAKWVEKAFYSLIGIVLTAVIVAMLDQVLRH